MYVITMNLNGCDGEVSVLGNAKPDTWSYRTQWKRTAYPTGSCVLTGEARYRCSREITLGLVRQEAIQEDKAWHVGWQMNP